jgi:uncharacterized protein YgfB (UPF0149 family)
MMQVTFREIARVLEGAGSQVVAAEGHGCLCGALCTSPDYTLERWLDELVAIDGEGEGEQERPPDDALRLLFLDTHRALRGDEMEFEPLLPDDDEPLERRATALAQWCQGFLYGFGTGKPMRDEDLRGQVNEILRDVSHIAAAAVDVGAAGEEEEEAYAEVVEYLRVGVQLIHDELTPVRDGERSEGDDADEDREDAGFGELDDDSDSIH